MSVFHQFFCNTFYVWFKSWFCLLFISFCHCILLLFSWRVGIAKDVVCVTVFGEILNTQFMTRGDFFLNFCCYLKSMIHKTLYHKVWQTFVFIIDRWSGCMCKDNNKFLLHVHWDFIQNLLYNGSHFILNSIEFHWIYMWNFQHLNIQSISMYH